MASQLNYYRFYLYFRLSYSIYSADGEEVEFVPYFENEPRFCFFVIGFDNFGGLSKTERKNIGAPLYIDHHLPSVTASDYIKSGFTPGNTFYFPSFSDEPLHEIEFLLAKPFDGQQPMTIWTSPGSFRFFCYSRFPPIFTPRTFFPHLLPLSQTVTICYKNFW